MNCLQTHQRSFALPLHFINGHVGSRPAPLFLEMVRAAEIRVSRRTAVKAASSGSMSSAEINGTEMEDEKKSEIYSDNMTQAMGAVLTYRHELGMNYDFILPDLIVGSCLQLPDDVDKLREIDVKTIFCLQQNSDLEYFDVNIKGIQDYAKQCGDIEHVRAEIRDFDGFDLRMRLPSVVSKLYRAINCNGGVTYIHCTAGLGRAPSVALAYMFWVLGYKLGEANSLLQGKRSCFPNLEAIKYATADILTGLAKRLVTLTWQDDQCSSVEVSGLDIGWEQRIPLQFDEDRGIWILERELPEGRYEYKYIIDGEWMCNEYELMTDPNKDGHINNYFHVAGTDSTTHELTEQSRDDYDLTEKEGLRIKQFLESYVDDE